MRQSFESTVAWNLDTLSGCRHIFPILIIAIAFMWGCGKDSESPIPAYYSAIAAGDNFSLALKPDGTLWAWGNNGYGQLGTGGNPYESTSIPVKVDSGYVAISAGGRHSLGIKRDGSLWAWGSNERGELGDGTQVNRSIPTRIDTGYASVAAGDHFSIALKKDGSLWSWGANSLGQLGNGTFTDTHIPTNTGWIFYKIEAGTNHALAIMHDGSLWAWGHNDNQQLGDGTITNRSMPVKVGENFIAISAGYFHSLAINQRGTLMCAGRTSVGSNYSAFSSIDSVYNFASAGGYWHMGDAAFAVIYTYGISIDGSLWSLRGESDRVSIGPGFAEVSNYSRHCLALKTDGTLWAWGDNEAGQLGDGTTVNRSQPVQVGGK